MARVARGEVYSFRPSTQVKWARGMKEMEGTAFFWIQEAGESEQPHSWVRLRLRGKSDHMALPSVEVMYTDPDYFGPAPWNTLEQAITDYVHTLFKENGWAGVDGGTTVRGNQTRPLRFQSNIDIPYYPEPLRQTI